MAGVDVPLCLLGDLVYSLLTWLIKPYPEGGRVTSQQLNFNHRLSQAHMTVERVFGRLKGHWHCLIKECGAHITFVSRIVSACCVLHNYSQVHNEDYCERDYVRRTEEEEGEGMGHHEWGYAQQQNSYIRNALCSYSSIM